MPQACDPLLRCTAQMLSCANDRMQMDRCVGPSCWPYASCFWCNEMLVHQVLSLGRHLAASSVSAWCRTGTHMCVHKHADARWGQSMFHQKKFHQEKSWGLLALPAQAQVQARAGHPQLHHTHTIKISHCIPIKHGDSQSCFQRQSI